MATKQATIEFLLDQLSGAGNITTRKMFGEYALYYDGKVVAFVCDDNLYLKPTDVGKSLVAEVDERPAYPGSKLYLFISQEYWEDREYLQNLIQQTAQVLPLPKPKKKKIK